MRGIETVGMATARANRVDTITSLEGFELPQ
jgi:hypothetical protein